LNPRRLRKWAAEFIVGGVCLLGFALALALIGIIAAGGWPSVFGVSP